MKWRKRIRHVHLDEVSCWMEWRIGWSNMRDEKACEMKWLMGYSAIGVATWVRYVIYHEVQWHIAYRTIYWQSLKLKLLKILLKVISVWNIGIKIMTGNEEGNFIGEIGLTMVIINIRLATFRTDSLILDVISFEVEVLWRLERITWVGYVVYHKVQGYIAYRMMKKNTNVNIWNTAWWNELPAHLDIFFTVFNCALICE